MSNQIQGVRNVEVSSVCNMACKYCLSAHISKHREPGLMTLGTFREVVAVIASLSAKYHQHLVWLHGTGEPLLNKNLVEMITYLKNKASINIAISTNGLLIDNQMVTDLKDAGINRIDVSGHDEDIAQKAHGIIKQQGIPSVLSYGFRKGPFDWAGQLDLEGANIRIPSCPWIGSQECFVLHDGRIVSCCFDVFGLNILGHITGDLSQVQIKEFELCHNCNHTIS